MDRKQSSVILLKEVILEMSKTEIDVLVVKRFFAKSSGQLSTDQVLKC